ncbi:MAG TPA: MarR family transcriptional regulator [Candidatus Solibacter sp.]|jgi:DNA-binding MarR family transcriptional regulator|nr:MarR family transcriptional regulator [Candidatus Solibacter sp.]
MPPETATTAPPVVSLTIEDADRLRLVITRLQRRLRRQANAGITPSQLAVLGTLNRLGPLTLGELAGAESVAPPSITRIAAALEEKQLVERVAVSDDRRSSRLRLTPKARRLIQTIRHERTAWIAARVAELSGSDIRALQRGIEALEHLAESGQ